MDFVVVAYFGHSGAYRLGREKDFGLHLATSPNTRQ
jgi:hypothetical protein